MSDATSDRRSIAAFFDRLAPARNALFGSNPVLDYEQQVRSKRVLEALDARAGDRILDIGCGNARDIVPLLERGAEVVGVDLSEGMIRQAREELAAAGHANVTLEVGDATQLRFPSGSFDKVLCSEVIEHIPDADLAVAEIARVLKPGGVLALSTPNARSWYGFDRYIVWQRLLRRRWNHPFDQWRRMDDLLALLRRHGFSTDGLATACYLPGFLLTYFLPRVLQQAAVAATARLEPAFVRLAPGNGYLLIVRAVKPTASRS